MNYAKSNGMITLEMTTRGDRMDANSPYLPTLISNPIWNSLTGGFAAEAMGEEIFITSSLWPRATNHLDDHWRTNSLKKNGVNIITHIHRLMINMSKFFYSPSSTKRKILDVIDDMKVIIQSFCREKFWIDWYGAYDIDPKNLVIWICVESDVVKSRLESIPELINTLRDIFVKHNYSKQAIPFVHIGIESQETVDRDSNGNWYRHFK